MKHNKPPSQENDEGLFWKKNVEGITEPQQSEAAMRENEYRYRAIVESFDGLIYICSPDYRVEFMNPRLIERTGYDGTGEYCYKVLHDRDSICPWCVNDRVFRGETVRWEIQSPKDNRWYYVMNTPIYHRDGRVSKQAMMQDITEFQQTKESLRQVHQELERRVEERTAHLRQANEQLLREIEERQQIEERLRESEARFLAFMQHLPGGAVIRDLQGRYLFANKAWEKAFAKEKTEWQGKTLEEVWPAKTAQRLRESDQQVILNPQPLETMITLEQEDGPHPWQINWFPILGHDGQPLMVGSVGIDVTKRQRVEAALTAERQRLFSILDELPVYVYLHGPDHTVRFANQVFRKHFGDPDGRLCYEILRGRSQPCEDCSTKRVFTTQCPQESQWTGPSGRIYQIHSYPFADVDGSLLVLKMGIDITELKQAEEALRESEERLRLANEAANIGTSDVDLETGQVRFSPELCAILGVPHGGEWNGHEAINIVHPEDRDLVLATHQRSLDPAGDGRIYSEHRIIRPNGEVRWLVWSGRTIFRDTAAGRVPGRGIAVVFDITERKRAEEELKLNEARLASLLRISQYSSTSIQKLLDYALDEAIALTGSKIGYIYFYDETTQQFTLNTWSKGVMQVCSIAERQAIYQLQETGIWGEAVRQARPIIVNDFQAPHPLKQGYPEGHAPLYKYLTIPVVSSDRIVAVVGVANKAADYDDADIRQLTLMMDAVWKIVERQQSQEALIESEKRFRQLVEYAADAFFLHDKGKIIEVNQQACNSLGYTREELQKMTIADLEVDISSEDLQKSWEQPKSPVTIRGTHRRKDGSTFPVEVRAGDITYDGRSLRLALARDITERLQAEEALKQSEIKYRTLVEAAPFGISIIGKDGRYKYLNPKFEELFGYTLEDIPTGRDWVAQAYPDSSYRKMVIADWKKELTKPQVGEVRPRTFRVRCKDGTTKVINFRAVALASGDCLIFYEDITQRVQAEQALRQSEENYRLLVNQIPAVVFKGYADGSVEFFDRKIDFLTGYKKEVFAANRLKWTDLILPEDIPGARDALLKALKGDGSYVREYRIPKQDGGILWIQERGQIFCNAAGRIDYISGVFYDISERKEVEEALRQSEEKYRLLVNQIPAVVFQGHADWSLDCPDRKIESLTGYAKEDFDSRRLKWCDLIPAEEMDYVKQTFVDAIATRHKSYVREHRIRKKSGEHAWVQCRGQIFLDDKGKVAYVSGVTFDITQRKQAEKALQESERLYRLLAENVSDVIWTADLNLRLTYVSPSVKFLRGFTPEEVMAQSLDVILTPPSLELARKSFAEAMAWEKSAPDSGRSWNLELEHLHKDGSTVWTEVKASFLQDEQRRPVGILGVTRDISRRKEAELKLRRREAILEAVSIAAEKFLQSESWEKEIQDILRRLGESADVSRAYIFENHVNAAGEILTSQRYEWAAPGIEPQMDNPHLQDLPWQAAGFGRWEEELSRGRMIVGLVRELSPAGQKLLASQDIKSIVALPIFVGQQWWGMIGFDDCLNEREWSPVELEALKTAASTLGAAILHERAEQALRKSEQKLRSLTAQLLNAQENERKRLAGELHDELGHTLVTLKFSIRSLEKQLTPEHISFTQEFKKMHRFVVETIKKVRRLYLDLSPGDLEDLGLTQALRDMIEDFAPLQKQVKWSVMLDNLDGIFPLPVQTAIYRVVQEALTNIGKHAKAKNVSIGAKREDQRITIIIEDDGKGFESSQVLEAKRSLGLLTMEERVKILGGTFTLWSQKKRGTRISFTIPFPEEG